LPRFAANISTLYPEHPLPARIGAAARDGFAAVEVQAPYAVDAAEFRRALTESRMKLVLMNAPQGDVAAGERGLAAIAGQEHRFESTIAQALDYARTVGARRIHVMAGRPEPGSDMREADRVYLRNLDYACDELRPHGISVTIEPINTRDMPGYFLTLPQQAAEVIVALHKDNLALQFDCYHAQIMVGDLARHLERHFPVIGPCRLPAPGSAGARCRRDQLRISVQPARPPRVCGLGRLRIPAVPRQRSGGDLSRAGVAPSHLIIPDR
jgi:hydroxypyruvate isomerase